MLDTLAEKVAVARIPITDQKSRRLVSGKRLDDLMRCPLGYRMGSDVEVDDVTPMMTKNDEGEEYTECSRRHREEISGDDVSNMIIQERTPRLRRRLPMPNHVLVDGRLGHIVAQQLKFGVNLRGAPRRILATHRAYQLADLSVDLGTLNFRCS